MLLTGVSALRTHERMNRQREDADDGTEADLGPLPSVEDFVAHATSALAPVAWHIIKDLSRFDEAALSNDLDDETAA